MFTLTETFWQLSRNRARTVILLLAAALLAGCMAFYLGSIRANQEAFTQNIMLFRRFQVPFFVLAISLIILAIFLIMRSSRQDIAIACSLGRPKLLSALSCFLAALALILRFDTFTLLTAAE